MRDINTIEFPGWDSVKENFPYYKQKFFDEKILAFRNVHADFAMQQDIMHFFGDNLGWYPNSSNTSQSHYFEDHHKHMNGPKIAEKDEWMLGWHVEWVEYENDPFYGATWNMTQFDCNYDTGNTCFVDMAEVYLSLGKDDAAFLDNCRVEIPKKDDVPVQFDYVKRHWLTEEKCLRTHLGGYAITTLVSVANKIPSQEEVQRFNALHDYIIDKVWNDESIRYVHRWQKGDMLIPDLFKLAHAVTGGFVQNQRRLDGMFGKKLAWGAPRKW